MRCRSRSEEPPEVSGRNRRLHGLVRQVRHEALSLAGRGERTSPSPRERVAVMLALTPRLGFPVDGRVSLAGRHGSWFDIEPTRRQEQALDRMEVLA